MIAKLIVHGRDRSEALARMRRALREFAIYGVSTTIAFHLGVLDNEEFIAGNVHLKLLDQEKIEVIKGG